MSVAPPVHRAPASLDAGRAHRRCRSILVAVELDRVEPTGLALAADRALQYRARLTVLCAWRPTRLVCLAALAGYDPDHLIGHEQAQAAAWLRRSVASLPQTISVTAICRRGSLVRRLARELRSFRTYDELLVGQHLSRREAAVLRQASPALSILSSADGDQRHDLSDGPLSPRYARSRPRAGASV